MEDILSCHQAEELIKMFSLIHDWHLVNIVIHIVLKILINCTQFYKLKRKKIQ